MNLKAVLEGILFIVGDEGTSIEEMVRVLGVNDEEVKKLLSCFIIISLFFAISKTLKKVTTTYGLLKSSKSSIKQVIL